jgi:hypothetical protein
MENFTLKKWQCQVRKKQHQRTQTIQQSYPIIQDIKRMCGNIQKDKILDTRNIVQGAKVDGWVHKLIVQVRQISTKIRAVNTNKIVESNQKSILIIVYINAVSRYVRHDRVLACRDRVLA